MMNQAAAELFELKNEQTLGKSLHTLIHHTKPSGVPYPDNECPLCIALNNGESLDRIPEIFWRRDNSFFSASVSCNPIIENGNITGAVVVIEDQSELQRLKSVLLEYQEGEEALYENLPLGLAWIDAESHAIVDINSYGLRLLKVTKDQIVGRVCQEFLCTKKDGICLVGTTGKTVHPQKSKIRDINGRVILPTSL